MDDLKNYLLTESEGVPPEIHLEGRRHRMIGNGESLKREEYCPNVMFNFVRHKLGAKTDFDMALKLDCSPAQISKMRHPDTSGLAVSDLMLVRISEATDIPTKELKRLAGMAG